MAALKPEAPVRPTYTDPVGAVSVLPEGATSPLPPTKFVNQDGQRLDDGRYAAFASELSAFIPAERLITDAVRTFAYGTDASFYRLTPKLVVKIHTQAEVERILPIAKRLGVPVTFRAGGTSLSGQALTDSVLLKLSHNGTNFRNYEVHGDGSTITVEPGLIGGEVNRILARHAKQGNHPIQYKIGPDPSSIDSCMIGGIVNNNSSGMCCGVSQNTYHTIKDLRIVMADGTVLDTANEGSTAAFRQTHAALCEGVSQLARRVQADEQLTSLIRRKFAIKCTTGYSLNALVDFPADEPIEIIKHLVVGSEGTLGFVSRATYNTVPEWPHKASAFVMFPDVHDACRGASVLRDETSVDAVEMFDRASLRQCEKNPDFTSLVDGVTQADPTAAGLLIECRGHSAEALAVAIQEVQVALRRAGLPLGNTVAEAKAGRKVEDFVFHEDPDKYNVYWNVRKGLIPIVGAARETGTSMLIEDVACPVDKLADMTVDLANMFEKFGYKDASCFGHALEGNLHLVFAQGFRTPEEVERFRQLMDEMAYIVATKHSGSLKGEHGTGRNIAPYVEMEWGTKATSLMWELKMLFDPTFVLNPGVILSRDTDMHVKFLKPSPAASPIVNHCIECGFCESNCPSKDVTLTPRQRIATYKEVHRLRAIEPRTADEQRRLDEFEKSWSYMGNATCAADGMCQEKCPVKINTGELVKSVRAEEAKKSGANDGLARMVANHFGTLSGVVPAFLNVVDVAHGVLGPRPLVAISQGLNWASGRQVPVWNKYMPKGAAKLNLESVTRTSTNQGTSTSTGHVVPRKVVYAPSCVTRMMGPARGDDSAGSRSVHEAMLSLFAKAGYEVIIPDGVESQCCGMMFGSKGLVGPADQKMHELQSSLLAASENGKWPVVMDTSPCLATMKTGLNESAEAQALRFGLYEPVEFIQRFLLDKLEFSKKKQSVAVHVPCSSKKMGLEKAMEQVAGMCAEKVTGTGIPCCGMAGDRGMRYPELTGSSLQNMKLGSDVTDGYSTSRTCEMSLSNHAGINFRGLVYLVDECTSAKQA